MRRARTRAALASAAMCTALALAMAPPPAEAIQPRDTGIVLLHGWGLQDEAGRQNPFAANWLLSKTLREAGYVVAEEEMPWGPRRLLDVSREGAMREIDTLVGRLRAAGARRIVVAGHSMGATMAIAYGGQRDVDAIVALAPGMHVELHARLFPDVAPVELARARALIAAGRGDHLAVDDQQPEVGARDRPLDEHVTPVLTSDPIGGAHLSFGTLREQLAQVGAEAEEADLDADLAYLRELDLVEFSGEIGDGQYGLAIPLMAQWIEQQQDADVVTSRARAEAEEEHA